MVGRGGIGGWAKINPTALFSFLISFLFSYY
jgi:hypothetical protein